MQVNDLVQQVLAKNPAASDLARELGPNANNELIKLTRNDDAKVRLIAVYCLIETGGPDAAIAFARLAVDPDLQVAGAAIRGLRRYVAQVPPRNLLEAFDHAQDAWARQQLMLAAGKLPAVPLPEIQKRHDAEKVPQAEEGSTVALAERGQPLAQAEFIRGLHAAKNRDLERYLNYTEEIGQPWLLPALLPILDDKTGLVWIGVDGIPSIPETLRACDIAINLVIKISGHRFSFPSEGIVRYTDAQIAEVKAFLQQQR